GPTPEHPLCLPYHPVTHVKRSVSQICGEFQRNCRAKLGKLSKWRGFSARFRHERRHDDAVRTIEPAADLTEMDLAISSVPGIDLPDQLRSVAGNEEHR